MAFPTAYHADSDADDEYGRTEAGEGRKRRYTPRNRSLQHLLNLFMKSPKAKRLERQFPNIPSASAYISKPTNPRVKHAVRTPTGV